jgi:hypothetical protein
VNKSPDSESPGTIAILVNLLRFFQASATEQVETLAHYDQACAEKGAPHLHDPLIELTEALYTYCGAAVSAPHHPDSFFVGPLPKEAVRLMQELSALAEKLLISNLQTLFSRDVLDRPEWQRVRALANAGLHQLGDLATQTPSSLYDLMCYVAD